MPSDPCPATPSSPADTLRVGDRLVPLAFVHHPRARRYVLRLRPDGTARVTVPRRGSRIAAREFAAGQTRWLARQLARWDSRPSSAPCWGEGTTFLFRGEPVRLQLEPHGAGCRARFGDQALELTAATVDVRPAIEAHLRRLAARELPLRVAALAAQAGLQVGRVSIRNQRSRWGSCSRAGALSLNWRLVQMPDPVRDYVIWHELMHRREPNHSPRFWRHVRAVCPDFEQARRWLRDHSDALR